MEAFQSVRRQSLKRSEERFKPLQRRWTCLLLVRLIYRLYGDNGKEHGNHYSILGLYRDDGKEFGNYSTAVAEGLAQQVTFA